MLSKLKAFVGLVLSYLQTNPGVVSLIVGQLVLLFAKFGLNVSDTTLYAIGAILVPVLLAYFKVAEYANRKAAVAAAVAKDEADK